MVILILNILVRRYLIRCIGDEINGLNSLYISILDFLAVAELGVGSAITFCMYKPIVDGDNDKVSALYGLFTKLYLIIGGIILAAGCIIMPLLPFVAKGYQDVDVNLYLTFGLTLIAVVMTYLFSSKTSLINAYKNNYITVTISSVGQILQNAVQIAVLVCTGSYIGYLLCRIATSGLQWFVTDVITRKKYSNIIKNVRKIDAATKKEVTKNIKAMFLHKIGGVLVNSADSIIISTFLGVVILGKYSNYTTIMAAMFSVLCLCFSPLTSVIGHMFVEESNERALRYLNFFHTFNYVLGVIFFLGYYAVIDNLISILFADGLELAKSVSFIITLNYFVQFMRQTVLLFRDATGTFYYDRWKPIAEGLTNIVLSVAFVFLFDYLWGADYAVVGVIAATILTNLCICHVVEPHVLYKYALRTSTKKYYIRNYTYIAIFTGLLVALNFTMIKSDNEWIELFANGAISLAYSLTASLVIILSNKTFRSYLSVFFRKIKSRKSSGVQACPADGESVLGENGESGVSGGANGEEGKKDKEE